MAADGTPLTFTSSGEGFVDAETGTTWDITGVATDGPLSGERFEGVEHLDTFWFAWATFQPETRIVGA